VTAASAALGRSGEERVADWYLGHGYEVVARNWRCPGGELDIVVARGRMVVFCEVKTRTSDRFGTPLESVTRAKQARIRSDEREIEDHRGCGQEAVRGVVVEFQFMRGYRDVAREGRLLKFRGRNFGPARQVRA